MRGVDLVALHSWSDRSESLHPYVDWATVQVPAEKTLAVSLAVVMVALAAYWMTRFMLINQLDNELLDVATVTATPIAADVESMGGLNADELRAASVTLLLVSSDGSARGIPGAPVTLEPGDDEKAVARTQTGSSARTVTDNDGTRYRMVAVPQLSSWSAWRMSRTSRARTILGSIS